MKKLFTLSLFLFSIQVTFSQLSKWEEDFLRNTDPQGYSYYNFKQGIANQGKQLVQGLTRKLNRYQSLIETQNPDELLADFEAKMQNIKDLEQDYIKQANRFAFNTGQQIGDAINRKDGMRAVSGVLGFLESNSAQKQAKKDLEAKKAALKQQRKQKMSEIYYKALEFNRKKKEEFLNRAAYAKSEKDEKYNLEFVKNLECFERNMKANFNTYSTGWLRNTCEKPEVPSVGGIENMFITKDVQLRKIAERKYKYYKVYEESEFEEAAIAYAAAAANEKPSAESYFLLGSYYGSDNPLLALSSFLTAKELNSNYKINTLNDRISESKEDVEYDIKKAIESNDVGYLNSFLAAGLDKLIRVNGKSILSFAISLDKPDAVQTILNSYIKGKSQSIINQKVQKTLMLCALNDSEKTIKRFTDLGVAVDFKIKNYYPIDIAVKSNSSKAFYTLLNLSNQKEFFQNKYGNSIISILSLAKNKPESAVEKIDLLSDREVEEIFKKLMSNFANDNYLKTITKSKKLKSLLTSTDTYYNQLLNYFAEEIKRKSSDSKAAAIYNTGIFNFNHIPIYKDLVKQEVKGSEAFKDESEFYTYALEYVKNKQISELDKVKENIETDKYNTLKNNLEREVDQLKRKTLDKASKQEINEKLYTTLAGSGDLYNNKLRNGFAKILEQQYGLGEFTALEMYNKVVELLREEIKTANDLKRKQLLDYLKKIEPVKKIAETALVGSANYRQIEQTYIQVALKRGAALPKSLVDKLKMKFVNNFGTNDEKENIAYLAYDYDNLDLYKALDRDFDLSKVKTTAGKSIPELLIDESKKPTSFFFSSLNNGKNNNKIIKYWSEDFNANYSDLLLKAKAKDIFYNNSGFYTSANKGKDINELLTIIKEHNFDINSKLDDEGNTLLHLIVKELHADLLYKDWIGGRWFGNGELASYNRFLLVLKGGVDKAAKNNNGETALDLFKQKERKIIQTMVLNLKTLKKYKQNLKDSRSKMTKEQFMRSFKGAATPSFFDTKAIQAMKKAAEKEWSKGIFVPNYNPKEKATEVYQAIVKALEY